MIYDTIRVDEDEGIVVLELHRPDRLNAMTATMWREIQSLLWDIDNGRGRVLVIRGSGRAFCSGADLSSIVDDVDVTDAAAVREFLRAGWQTVVAMIRALRVPSVAAVHGVAYGGGANLALACDLVIAAENAVFCQSYVDRGIPPDLGVTSILPDLVGSQQARRLLLLGDRIEAPEALDLGLVLDVVPLVELDARARALAERLAAKDATATRLIRTLLQQNAAAPLGEALDRESDAIGIALGRPAFRESIAGFLDRS